MIYVLSGHWQFIMFIKNVTVDLIERRFDKPVGGSTVTGVDIIVVTLTDKDGLTGLGFSYVIGGGGGLVAKLTQTFADRFIANKSIIDPRAKWVEIQKSFNRTGDGPNILALAALDVGIWDLKANIEGVPLNISLGGKSGEVPVYASSNFNPNDTFEEAIEKSMHHIGNGYTAIKPRVNATEKDGEFLEAIRLAIGDDIDLMADANEKGDFESATRLLELASALDMKFIEEPLPAAKVISYRRLSQLNNIAPIALGEHLQGQDRFLTVMEDKITSFIQPDLAMAGGITPCLEISIVAAERNIILAPHFLPGLFIHLNGTFDGELLLEDFPLIEPAFEGWPKVDNKGKMSTPTVSGHGLTLKT